MGSLYELRMLVTFCLTAKCKLKLKLKWKEFICHLVEQIQMQNILSKYIFFSQALDHNLQIWIFVEQDTSFYDGNEIFDLLDCTMHQ